MKNAPAPFWQTWESGVFVGDKRPIGRVTVEKDWQLDGYLHPPKYKRIRSWQNAANDQAETEIPGVKSINIDRTVEADVATCTITVHNQQMETVFAGSDIDNPNKDGLGRPGAYTFTRGISLEAQARWGHQPIEPDLLRPNSLIRIYQGFSNIVSGSVAEIKAQVASGDLFLTGVFLIDDVTVNASGMLEIRCRDMAKLLVEQFLYPPIVPPELYAHGLKFCRYINKRVLADGSDAFASRINDLGAAYAGGVSGQTTGHPPQDAFDSGDNHGPTYWMSEGYADPSGTPWIEFGVGSQLMNYVSVWTLRGSYSCHVSIHDGSAWVDTGQGNINGIPFVAKSGIAWEDFTDIYLGDVSPAKIRLTFTNLQNFEQLIGSTNPYRVGVRYIKALYVAPEDPSAHDAKVDGNAKDYLDIIKRFLLWAGWYLQSPGGENVDEPAIYGTLEETGAWPEECVNPDVFDKKPVIDCINEIKQIVGYNFWIDEEGAAWFALPNWWSAGNYLPDGSRTTFIPEFDESKVLTDFSETHTDRFLRSHIIISSNDPSAGLDETVTTVYKPTYAKDDLRLMYRQLMIFNQLFLNYEEQETMAELISLHLWFLGRQATVTCVGNPCITLDDQIRVWERNTGTTYIYRVLGINSVMDLDEGTYEMTLNLNWLGDQSEWAIEPPDGTL